MAGGDFNFVFTILPRGADYDGDVDGDDQLFWSRQVGLELDWVM